MSVDLLELPCSKSRRAVAPSLFPSFQFRQRAVNADQDDVLGGEQVEAVEEAPVPAQHMVHHDVVAGRGHAGDRSVETHGGPVDFGLQMFVRDVPVRSHGVEGVHGHVEERLVQDPEKLSGDTRLAGTRRPVQEDDRPVRRLVRYFEDAGLADAGVAWGRHRRFTFQDLKMPCLSRHATEVDGLEGRSGSATAIRAAVTSLARPGRPS
ncbi:protein of unknown function [Streptomyces murinus]